MEAGVVGGSGEPVQHSVARVTDSDTDSVTLLCHSMEERSVEVTNTKVTPVTGHLVLVRNKFNSVHNLSSEKNCFIIPATQNDRILNPKSDFLSQKVLNCISQSESRD